MAITRVKVCCISSIEEARLAVRLGAAALGLVSEMPSGPGVIPEQLIADIVAAVPPTIPTFLLTSRTEPDQIVAQQRRCRTSTLQICDYLTSGALAELRRALPGVALVPVVHVDGEASVARALASCQSGRCPAVWTPAIGRCPSRSSEGRAGRTTGR